MKFNQLSADDQALLQTQFPAELEKEASAEIALAQECYSTGFAKFASETAQALEKLAEESEKGETAEEEEKEHEKKLDEEQKKEASARGAFIARGYIDGLKKLGSETYGDEMAYLYPFIQEKMAAPAFVESVRAGLKKNPFAHIHGGKDLHPSGAVSTLEKAKELAGKAGGKVSAYGKGIVEHGRRAMQGTAGPAGTIAHQMSPLTSKERIMEGAKAVGKAGAPVAAVGGAAAVAHKLKGKKDEQ